MTRSAQPRGHGSVPRHHFPDDVLFDYVAGNTAEAVSIVIACHASMCSVCLRQIRWLEELAAHLGDALPPSPLREDAFERVLARLSDEPAPAKQPPAALVPPPGLEFVAAPVWPYLKVDPRLGRPLFESIVEGIGCIELTVKPVGGTARLVELDPSITVPLHDHGGPEYGLLFSGGLQEEDGRVWHRGDVFYRLPGEQHLQAVLPGEACIALVVNEGSLVPITPAGDVLKLFSA